MKNKKRSKKRRGMQFPSKSEINDMLNVDSNKILASEPLQFPSKQEIEELIIDDKSG